MHIHLPLFLINFGVRCTLASRSLFSFVLTREWDKVGGAKRFRPCPTDARRPA